MLNYNFQIDEKPRTCQEWLRIFSTLIPIYKCLYMSANYECRIFSYLSIELNLIHANTDVDFFPFAWAAMNHFTPFRSYSLLSRSSTRSHLTGQIHSIPLQDLAFPAPIPAYIQFGRLHQCDRHHWGMEICSGKHSLDRKCYLFIFWPPAFCWWTRFPLDLEPLLQQLRFTVEHLILNQWNFDLRSTQN